MPIQKTSYAGHAFRLFEEAGGELRPGAYADEIGIPRGGQQLSLGQCFRVMFDAGVTIAAKGIHRGLVDPFQQQNFDFGFIERGFLLHEGAGLRRIYAAVWCTFQNTSRNLAISLSVPMVTRSM